MGSEEFANFDLGRFTLAGWLMFLASIVVGLGAGIAIGFAVQGFVPEKVARKIGGFAAFGLIAGCFFAMKAILHSLGVVLVRPKKSD